MKTEINNDLIRTFSPCYDPAEVGIDNKASLTVKEWVVKYRDTVKNKQNIIWLLCRNDFMTDKDLRLFAVWCAREALKLISDPDQRSVNACDVAERFANGDVTSEELGAAWSAAWSAARSAVWDAAWSARDAAAESTARDAADAAAFAATDAARSAQIDQLLTYFT